MKWLEEFEQNISAKTAHMFMFHGNVADDILFGEDFLRLYQLVPRIESLKPAAIIVFFNLATGVRFPNKDMKKVFLQLIIKPIVDLIPANMRPSPEEYFEAHKYDIEHVLTWFNNLLMFSWKTALEEVEKAQKNQEGGNEFSQKYLKNRKPKDGLDVPFATVVFEYQESKTPPESDTGSSRLDRRVIETFQWWAQLPEIAETSNIVILASDSIGRVAAQLHDQSKGVIPIAIPRPNIEEQEQTITAFKNKGMFIPVAEDVTIPEMAKLTSGLSRVELRQIFKQAQIKNEQLTSTTLFEKKAEIIQALLGDIVRIRKPPWGWEAIGGMDDRIALAMMWTEALRRGEIARLPKGGILLIGAPGTGKTVFAEAFAHELDIPFMEVMNTFNQFVGVSEQNMQNLLDIAWAQRPVVLFFDEIEQLLLPRGSVYHGDSGVFARSSRMLMQFFSDPKIHGQVLIFAATNRPNLLDIAIKRAGRFGAKVPFLIPTKGERPSIWKALLRKEVIRLGLMKNCLDISQVVSDDKLIAELSAMVDFWESEGKLTYGPPPSDSNDPVPMTGAEMEDIIGLAFQPFLETVDIEAFQRMSQKERNEMLADKCSMGKSGLVLTGEMLKDAIRNYLPHEDIRLYNVMNDLALLSVNDLRFIPLAYRERARKLRVKQAQEKFLPQ